MVPVGCGRCWPGNVRCVTIKATASDRVASSLHRTQILKNSFLFLHFHSSVQKKSWPQCKKGRNRVRLGCALTKSPNVNMARTKQTARKSPASRRPPVPIYQPPARAMDELMKKLFGDESNYKPRFYPARTVVEASDAEGDKKKRAKPNPIPEEGFKVLTHPRLLDFLTPPEIISLWQSCTTCWNSIDSGKKKKAAMLPPVFRYFKLSEESAQHVHEKKAGGCLSSPSSS